MKRTFIAVFVIVMLVGMIRWYNRPNNGIHGLGKNVCLIQGECVVINWDATEAEAEMALARWQQLRHIESR